MKITGKETFIQRDSGREFTVKHITTRSSLKSCIQEYVVLQCENPKHTVTLIRTDLEAKIDVPNSAWSVKESPISISNPLMW